MTVFLTDRDVGVAELARAVEERGFASLFLPEHTHIPVRRATPAPTGEHPLPGAYARTLDPWVALSAAGAVTTRLRLGTGVALPAQHDPIALAKQIATLDHLSGGRVTLGVGYGWNLEEIADHGIDPQRRRAVVREHILAMQALWRDDVASFDGEHVAFEPTWAWPKPVQRPRVRTLVGGAAARRWWRTWQSGPTAGCRWAGPGSPRRCRGCAPRLPRPAATPPPCRSCRWAPSRPPANWSTSGSSASPRSRCAWQPATATWFCRPSTRSRRTSDGVPPLGQSRAMMFSANQPAPERFVGSGSDPSGQRGANHGATTTSSTPRSAIRR